MLKSGQRNFELRDEFWGSYAENSGYHTDPDFIQEAAKDYSNWHPNVKTAAFVDPELLSVFADNIPPTLEWLAEFGVTVDMEGLSHPYFIKVPTLPCLNGGGLQVIENLTPEVEKRGGKFLFETTASELLLDDMGKVSGVKATTKNNEPVEISAKSVILASGGFQGNPQMLVQYMGPQARYLRPVAKGGYYDKGEGLRMALAHNAAPAGDWSDCHHELVDPRSGKAEALVHIYQCGIVVNRWGKRFMDECPSDFSEWLEEPCKAIKAQPGGVAYLIYDDQLHSADYQGWRYGVRSEIAPFRGETLAELAGQIGVPAAALEDTVAEYNAACVDSDAVEYGAHEPATFDFGGQATQGLAPNKSNYAKRIEKGPYFCYPLMASICFTYGGLRVTPRAEVLNFSGEVIPGLYAAGETVGMHYGHYTSATSVLRALVFGRLAGASAAAV